MGARLILLCGLPGSGKTTLARELEATTGAIRMNPDEWMTALGIDLWDERARSRVEGLQWDRTQRLLERGRSVVIEWGLWNRHERDALRQRARALGAAVELRYLDVPMDELISRVTARNDEVANGRTDTVVLSQTHLLQWAAMIEAPDAEEQALFDAPVR